MTHFWWVWWRLEVLIFCRTSVFGSNLLIIAFVLDYCWPTINVLPRSPFRIRRMEDIYITPIVSFNCNEKSPTSMKWSLISCPSMCPNESSFNQSINTARNELFLPFESLNYGFYEIKLTVTATSPPFLSATTVVHIEIIPKNIIISLLPVDGTKIIHHYAEDLLFDPGKYSIDSNRITINHKVSHWVFNFVKEIFEISGVGLQILLSPVWWKQLRESLTVRPIRRFCSRMFCWPIMEI